MQIEEYAFEVQLEAVAFLFESSDVLDEGLKRLVKDVERLSSLDSMVQGHE